jgi:lipoprotein-releasing system permease protein
MPITLFITKRFTGSRKNSRLISIISTVTITGIAIGVATLIITLSVLSGFDKTLTEKIINFNSHIQITSFSNRQLGGYETIRPVLLEKMKPYVTGISPFAAQLSIIKSKKYTEGVTVKGILTEFDVSKLNKYIKQGKYNLSYRKLFPPIIIGQKLAEKLFLNVGDIVTIFTLRNNKIPSPENPPGIKQFTVEGIFESGMSEYDDLLVYINLNNARELFGMDDKVNGYDITVNNISKIDSLSESLNDYLGYPYFVRTIYKIYQSIFTWIDLQKRLIPISLTLIVVVAAFNIIGTLLMIVLEKGSEIGILKSLGARKKQIISIFLFQGIYLAIIGIIIGNILAFVLSFLQLKFEIISLPPSVYFMSKAPIEIDLLNYLIVSAAALILCILSSFIPSYIASKINPISALRFE